jgi:hypothetical protein
MVLVRIFQKMLINQYSISRVSHFCKSVGCPAFAYRLGQGQDFAKRFAAESDKLLNGPNMTELAKDRQDLTASVKQYRDKMAKFL